MLNLPYTPILALPEYTKTQPLASLNSPKQLSFNDIPDKRLYLSSPHMSDEGFEFSYVQRAFETNWLAPVGENLNDFEEKLSNYVGIEYALAVQSGTAAIHLALKNLGIRRGDVVFVQSLTFAASLNPVLYEQATPVLIDSEKETWNMDPIMLEKAFQYYKPKAVIVVHLYGNSAKIDEIKALCDKYNTPIIEDAAESLGATYKGQHTGTFGDYGIYSFNGNKIITTSGGGMLVSNNQAGIEKAKYLATQAKEPAPYYQHTQVGYNYRMSNVLAGIGLGQMQVLDERIEKKRFIYETYRKELTDIPEISLMPTHEGANNWLTCILINASNITPMMLMEALETKNIESRMIWKPMHLQPICKAFDFFGTRVSDEIFARGLCLPSDTKMTIEDLERVISVIKRFFILNRMGRNKHSQFQQARKGSG